MVRLSFISAFDFALCAIVYSSVGRQGRDSRYPPNVLLEILEIILEMIDDRRYRCSRKLNPLIHVVGLQNRDRVWFFDDLKNRDSPDANGLDFRCHKRESPFSQNRRYLVRALHPRSLISDTHRSDAAGHSAMRGSR